MPDYRAYPVDKNGHILTAPEIITADEDEAALAAARRFVQGHDVEVWLLDRKIGVLKHYE